MPTVISGTTLNALTTVSWGVMSLFTNNEQGVWFDPSDFLPNWRRNLFRYSEDFSNTFLWSKSATATVTTGQTDPFGGTTAAKIEFASIFQWHGQSYTFSGGETITHSLWLRGDTAGTITLTDASGGAWGKKVTISTSWQRFDVTATNVPAGQRIVAVLTGGGDLTTVYVAFEQLELGSSATAYQKITDGVADYYTYQTQPVMFQDSAGTIPVTAVEQPVGLLLDKSKGLALGSELVTNGDFSNGLTGWLATGGYSTSVSGNALVFNGGTSTGGVYQSCLTVGKVYQITYTIVTRTAGAFYVWAGTTAGTARTAPGTYTETRQALGDGLLRVYGQDATFVGTIDNISVREVAGNHASQSTSASRPVLSARVNLLRYSEQFDNVIWDKTTPGTNITISANATTAPDGTSTADLAYPTVGGATCYTFQTTDQSGICKISAYAKASGKNVVWLYLKSSADGGVAYFDLSDQTTQVVAGSVSTFTATISPAGSGWYKLTATASASLGDTGSAPAGIGVCDAKGSLSITKSGTSGVYIWGADLRFTNVGTNLPPYQRVGAAVTATTNPAVTGVPDYDTNGFPMYLRFDGVDDWLVTSTIDPGAVNKAQIFSGMRRTAVTDSYQCFFETSSSTDGNNGVVAMFSEGGAFTRIYGQSRGTIAVQAYPSSGVFPNITTNVLTVQSDISAPILSLRSNETSVASTTSSQGTGNYLAYPLYIGRRGGTTFPASMQLYNLILRFSATNLETPFIQTTEAYINSKTKAY